MGMLEMFSERSHGFRPSPVGAVFDLSMQPGMISLAGGNPDLSLLPREDIAQRTASIIAEEGLEVLQYGAGQGLDSLIEIICEFMRAESTPGVDIDPANIQVTAGSQMGLDLVSKLSTNPGDTIVAEGPTYTGALGVFEGYQLDVQHARMDDQGLVPDALDQQLADRQAQGACAAFSVHDSRLPEPHRGDACGFSTPRHCGRLRSTRRHHC